MLTIGKLGNFDCAFWCKFSYLFLVRKLAVKHRLSTSCYPMCMEMLLLATVTALLTVIIIDTGRKRRTYLCQRVRITKRR